MTDNASIEPLMAHRAAANILRDDDRVRGQSKEHAVAATAIKEKSPTKFYL
jgi:hypothetical protein